VEAADAASALRQTATYLGTLAEQPQASALRRAVDAVYRRADLDRETVLRSWTW